MLRHAAAVVLFALAGCGPTINVSSNGGLGVVPPAERPPNPLTSVVLDDLEGATFVIDQMTLYRVSLVVSTIEGRNVHVRGEDLIAAILEEAQAERP